MCRAYFTHDAVARQAKWIMFSGSDLSLAMRSAHRCDRDLPGQEGGGRGRPCKLGRLHEERGQRQLSDRRRGDWRKLYNEVENGPLAELGHDVNHGVLPIHHARCIVDDADDKRPLVAGAYNLVDVEYLLARPHPRARIHGLEDRTSKDAVGVRVHE